MGPRRQRYRPYYWGPHCIVYTRLRRLSFGVVVKTFYVPREKTNTKHIKNWQSSPNQTNKRRYKYVCKKRLNNVLFRSGRGMEYSQHIVNSTRPFGARAAFAARYACSGRQLSFQKTRQDFSTLWQAFSPGDVQKRPLPP